MLRNTNRLYSSVNRFLNLSYLTSLHSLETSRSLQQNCPDCTVFSAFSITLKPNRLPLKVAYRFYWMYTYNVELRSRFESLVIVASLGQPRLIINSTRALSLSVGLVLRHDYSLSTGAARDN